MTKIRESKGHLFMATLTDGTTLYLQSGEQATIKNSLVSESLLIAESKGLVSISEEVADKKSTINKTGGADK